MRYSNDYMSIRKMFWDGGSYNLDSEGIKHCLERALKDFTPRTDKRQQEEVSASVSLMLEKLKENGFLEKFERYFKRDGRRQQKEYDEWHHQQCLLFISTLTDHKIRNSVSYGKAQKIVNMTMKTIYCLNGADDYDSRGYFDFCHMALDSYIMDWFRAEVANWYNNNHKKRQQRIKISKEGGLLPKWSKLEFLENSEKFGFTTYDQNPDTRVVNSQYHYKPCDRVKPGDKITITSSGYFVASFTAISDTILLSDLMIDYDYENNSYGIFDESTNVYEYSNAKKRVDAWYEDLLERIHDDDDFDFEDEEVSDDVLTRETVVDLFGPVEDIEKVVIPAYYTVIGKRAFYGCTNLKCVEIHKGLERIETDAFSNTSDSIRIIYEGTGTQWDEIPKGDNWDGPAEMHICPQDMSDLFG